MKGLGWLVGLGTVWLILLIIFSLLPLILWIWQMVRLSKRESKTGLWIVLVLGLALFIFGFIIGGFFWGPLIAGIVGLFLGREEEQKKSEYFWCGLCHTKYQEEFLGGETAHEGKICRSCLGKRQRHGMNTGESFSQPHHREPDQRPYQPREEFYQSQDRGRQSYGSERKDQASRALLRELGRKQRKKNGYLTQFIINLAVLQWLFPLLVILALWFTMKEQLKVEALKNPGLGLMTEISFGTVFKNIFKIMTSEHMPMEDITF